MKKVLAIAVALITILAMSACGAQSQSQALNVFAATEPESIDPMNIAWSHEFTLVYHTFDGLMRWDATVPGSKPVLGDAKEIKWDDTKTKATVTLRDDIVWSDGKKVTAQDYEYAWKRHVEGIATAYGYTMVEFFKGGADAIKVVQDAADAGKTLSAEELQAAKDLMQVKATGDKTLTFELSAPCPYFDYVLSFANMVPVRKDVIDANGVKWTTDPKTYISNGRYVMAERKPNESITLKKNEKYWDKKTTKMGTINFMLMKDEVAAYAAYQSGQLDFIQSIPLGEMETALKSPEYISGGLIGTYYFDLNVTKPPLDNPKVRQALALTVDRKFIVDQVTKQNQIPAYAMVSEGIVDTGDKTFRANGKNYIESDYAKATEQAKKLLEEAGYPGGKGMPKVEFTYNADNAGHKLIAEAVTNMWKTALGIDAEIVPVEGSVFNSYRMELKHMVARDGWICDWNDATSMLNLFLSNSGNNHTGWKNADYDAKVASAANATGEERSKILHEAEDMIMDAMPAIPVYYYTNNFMLKPYVKGACFSPLGNQFFWNCTLDKK